MGILDEYESKFGYFPFMLVMGLSDEEIEEIIKDCLKNNKPYEPKLKKGAKY